MSIGNTMAIVVLRSPLHRMMSRSLLVLTYTGRRSGTEYSLPLQYVAVDDALVVWAGNAKDKTWWRNFETPRTATIRLRGRGMTAIVSVVDDPARQAESLRAYVDRYPYATATGRPKFFGKRWHPTDDELAEVATSTVWIAIEPHRQPDRVPSIGAAPLSERHLRSHIG